MGAMDHQDIQHWGYSDSKVMRQIEEKKIAKQKTVCKAECK